jgi:ABC-type phosphate transport system permease subunit
LKGPPRGWAKGTNVSPAAERAFVAAARLCAVVVVAIAPIVVLVLALGTGLTVFRNDLAVSVDLMLALFGSTLAFGVIGASAGTAIGVGAALFAIEVASPVVRQVVKALTGGLHAVPAAGFGLAAAGALLFSSQKPGGLSTLTLATMILTIMIASVVFVQMRRELSRVPVGVREAASAMGADTVQVALRAVLPAMRRKINGIWWAAFALALGEGTALSMIFAAANTHGVALGTLASVILQTGAAERGAGIIGVTPAALVLLVAVAAATLLGRRATGEVTWP